MLCSKNCNRKILVTILVTGFFGILFQNQAKAKRPSLKKITSKDAAKKVAPKLPPIGGNLKTQSLGIGLGQTFLKGNFDKYGQDSITMDIYYDYAASYSFDLIANFHYSTHEFNGEKITLPGLALGIKSKFYNFDNFSPFTIAGFGFYRPSAKRFVNGVLTQSKEQITFGWHAGVGAELRLNQKTKFSVIAHYHNPFDIKQEVGPAVVGSYAKLLLVGFYSF